MKSRVCVRACIRVLAPRHLSPPAICKARAPATDHSTPPPSNTPPLLRGLRGGSGGGVRARGPRRSGEEAKWEEGKRKKRGEVEELPTVKLLRVAYHLYIEHFDMTCTVHMLRKIAIIEKKKQKWEFVYYFSISRENGRFYPEKWLKWWWRLLIQVYPIRPSEELSEANNLTPAWITRVSVPSIEAL